MTETPRPDPWEDVGREIVGLGDLRMAERLLAVVNAARAADAARHRAEIASLRAVMTADVDRLLEQAETIRQQQARIAELEAALERIAAMDFDANEDGRRNLYSGAARFVSAWLIARQALETP